MARSKILINRAPVLTLWAAIVAERLGFNHDEALSLGKAMTKLASALNRMNWLNVGLAFMSSSDL